LRLDAALGREVAAEHVELGVQSLGDSEAHVPQADHPDRGVERAGGGGSV
jgi:hypothetical protein